MADIIASQEPLGRTEVRLLICMTCKTIDEMTDYTGPPDRDDVLAYMVEKHRTAGVPHQGQMMRVDESVWGTSAKNDIVREITKQMERGSTTGFSPEMYATMSTLRDDAMKCWVRDHNRDPACGDYKSDGKRLSLGREHAMDRKDLGLDPRYDADNPAKTRYLCEWCPVHSLVQQAARKRAGMYDK